MAVDVERLLDEISNQEGLADYGHASFRDGLERFIDSATGEAQLTALGVGFVESAVRNHLRNRLRVTDWHRRHPEVAASRIEAPIIVVGLSRTGTTALSRLLARDPSSRSLLMWEGSDSVPPPTRETYRIDPRFEQSKAQGLLLYDLKPELKSVHYDPPDAPVECSVVLAQHFTALSLSTLFNMPSYDAWLTSPECDFGPAYAYHRQVLQVLQSDYSGRWQLKYPGHGLAMEALGSTFPDALFVMTHRDPVKAVASVCSTVNAVSSIFSDADHRSYIAEHWSELAAAMINGVLDFRDRHGNAAFYDIDYRDLVSDPVGAVEGMYGYFGLDFSPEVAHAMRAGAAEHQQAEHGRHAYSLDDVRLDRGLLEERFASYIDRFDVAAELA